MAFGRDMVWGGSLFMGAEQLREKQHVQSYNHPQLNPALGCKATEGQGDSLVHKLFAAQPWGPGFKCSKPT